MHRIGGRLYPLLAASALALASDVARIPALPSTPRHHDLSFAERVEAQRAIERLYYSHQIGAKQSFEEAVPRALLERKVRNYLRQSAALRDLWHDPITAEALDREVARITAHTRLPERLRDLYAALGNDPLLVRETLGRASLAGRLARSFYDADQRLHAAERGEAQAIRDSLADGRIDPESPHARRQVLEVAQETSESGAAPRDEPPAPGEPIRLRMETGEFGRWRGALPARAGVAGAVEEENGRFLVRVVLVSRPGSVRVAEYSVPKASWDAWWEEAGPSFDERSIAAETANVLPLPSPGGASPGGESQASQPDDSWSPTSLATMPVARYSHSTVWTGSLMIVWGGHIHSDLTVQTGSRYDPLTDTWAPTTTVNAPLPRYTHSAVWTGARMIVWGGRNDATSTSYNTGGRYDPVTDSWLPTSTLLAPPAGSNRVAVWTGSRMLIWGGGSAGLPGTGALYDPELDQWTPMSSSGAPTLRAGPAAAWTGSRLVVWGGASGNTYFQDGGRYDPATDQWSGVSTVGAPAGRTGMSKVWTGSQFIVWGGWDGHQPFADGGRYDPVSDQWSSIASFGELGRRMDHSAVWTGDAMLIWGGSSNTFRTNVGGKYDPVSDTWTATTDLNAPFDRVFHSAIWTGDKMIIWGGYYSPPFTLFDDGGRYDPSTDTWSPTSRDNVPSARSGHPAVWTGSQMIVWGGGSGGIVGGRYDPMLDTWNPTSTAGMPQSRSGHSAVWSGQEMIVWGGIGNGYLKDGGMYNSIADTWSSIPGGLGNPSLEPRCCHSAVWTGTRMIIWGGRGTFTGPTVNFNDGKLFNPALAGSFAAWSGMSSQNAPSARNSHPAVWTGSRMIVWGEASSPTGGIYDPATNAWTPTSTSNAPQARFGHTLVWDGHEMLVWGGRGSLYLSDGAAYDPVTTLWRSLANSGAPSARSEHTAVWTGSRMIVWGGQGPGSSLLGSGGRYDPYGDAWQDVSLAGAPSPRSSASAVWTGASMIVWGGSLAGANTNTGGVYSLDNATDLDGDGFSVSAGDCDDLDPDVWPGAAEICDGRDNDCDGILPGVEADADYDGFLGCTGDCLDTNTLVHPGAVEACDGLDSDCDGALPEIEIDHDGDGYRQCAECNDANPLIKPNAPETCDGVDNDCDGAIDESFPNSDGDARPDCSDCAPLDGTVFASPIGVTNLVAAEAAPLSFAWDSQAPLAGSNTMYDAFSGSLSDLRQGAGDYSGGACILANWLFTSFQDELPDPAPGEGVYYLVRARNACGTGTFGTPGIDASAALSAAPCP